MCVCVCVYVCVRERDKSHLLKNILLIKIIKISIIHCLTGFLLLLTKNVLNLYSIIYFNTDPQWPRGLRRGSVAARLLGLRNRVPQAV